MRPNEVLKKLPVSVITLQGEALYLLSFIFYLKHLLSIDTPLAVRYL
jgi:hypothetical protein